MGTNPNPSNDTMKRLLDVNEAMDTIVAERRLPTLEILQHLWDKAYETGKAAALRESEEKARQVHERTLIGKATIR